MPYAEVNDIRMYYEELGSGTPFVLMHGAAGAILKEDHLVGDLVQHRVERASLVNSADTMNPVVIPQLGELLDRGYHLFHESFVNGVLLVSQSEVPSLVGAGRSIRHRLRQ